MPKKGQTKPDDQMNARYHKMRVNGKQINVCRYIMEQKLGRPLQTGEYVHHINGNKLDDRIENLELVTPKDHANLHNRGRKCSAETRAKVSQSLKSNQRHKGKLHTPETKAKITASLLGHKRNLGKTVPQETRDRISATMKRVRQERFWSTKKTK